MGNPKAGTLSQSLKLKLGSIPKYNNSDSIHGHFIKEREKVFKKPHIFEDDHSFNSKDESGGCAHLLRVVRATAAG